MTTAVVLWDGSWIPMPESGQQPTTSRILNPPRLNVGTKAPPDLSRIPTPRSDPKTPTYHDACQAAPGVVGSPTIRDRNPLFVFATLCSIARPSSRARLYSNNDKPPYFSFRIHSSVPSIMCAHDILKRSVSQLTR